MTSGPLALITVVHGRHDHLLRQQESLAAGRPAEIRVVVALDDPQVEELVPGASVVPVAGTPDGLPLAAARNAGAAAARRLGAERLVFLDVDCLVGPDTLAGYAEPEPAPATVWSGPVTYLREADRPYPLSALGDLDDPHPARPDPGPGGFRIERRWELFWSLSFALDVETWTGIGGFDEAYVGYGAEDTDFGQRARRSGCRLVWAGGARAYHQWHPSGSPPVRHRNDIVRNANLFHDRWGWWPMTGWLDGLRDLGLVELVGARWQVVA